MPTSFNRIEIVRQKLAGRIVRDIFANGGGAIDNFYALDPSRVTSIIITHNAGDTPLVSVTNTLDASDDLENAAVLFGQIYDGTSTPFIAGDSKGLTGLRIQVTPTSGDVEVSIIQYGRGN